VFEALVVAVAAAAGAVGAVAGFGIGSLLTPLFAVAVDTKTAVAAVSIPHVVGTGVRMWRLRRDVDRQLLWRFGLTSAAGGLTGALIHTSITSRALALIFGGLLVFAGVTQLTGVAPRWRLHGPIAWIAGALSGLLGGLVGNQGGIRSAAMLGFDVSKAGFVATATASALFVDAARMPVYVASEWQAMTSIWPLILLATAGVVVGTVAGNQLLRRVPESRFRTIVGITILLLGIATLLRGRA
jgi:uncharacterized protein